MLVASLVILQLLIFAGLIFIFRKVMAQNVVLATQHLDELNQDYDEKAKEINRRLEEANTKAQEIVTSAMDEAEKTKTETIRLADETRDKTILAARTQAQEMIEQAEKSRNQLLLEIEERIAKEAVGRACDLIHDTLPEEFRRQVHGQWVDDLLEASFASAQRLRLPEGTAEANIVSAFPLNEEQRKKISKKIKDAFGSEIKINEEVDSKVVAGLAIKIGSLVFDGSLKNKIKEKAR